MAKELKTNAMRFLDKNKIEYKINVYECDEFIDGVTVANALGQPVEETFKTLVAKGKSGSYCPNELHRRLRKRVCPGGPKTGR